MADEAAQPAEESFTPKSLGSLFDSAEPLVVDKTEEKGAVQEESKDDTEEKPKPEVELEEGAKTEQKGETDDGSPPSSDKKDEIMVPLSAMHGERDRRQAAEKELVALKAKPAPEAPRIDLPSIYDGEGKFQEGILELIKTTARQENFNERIKVSQAEAIKEFGEEKVQKALDKMTPEMTKNPKYVDRFRASASPFMEIVQMAEDLDKAEKLSDPDYVAKWEQQEREKIEVKVRAELEGKAKVEQDIDDAIPDSLSGSRSSGDLKSGTPYKGPKPLADILST